MWAKSGLRPVRHTVNPSQQFFVGCCECLPGSERSGQLGKVNLSHNVISQTNGSPALTVNSSQSVNIVITITHRYGQ